jgi:hypothetical protein
MSRDYSIKKGAHSHDNPGGSHVFSIVPHREELLSLLQANQPEAPPRTIYEDRSPGQCQLCGYVPRNAVFLELGLCVSKKACRKRQQEGRAIDRQFKGADDVI